VFDLTTIYNQLQEICC